MTKLSEKKQYKKDKQFKVSAYQDRLRYLVQLIESSISILNRQLSNFEKLSDEVMADLTEQHFLKIIASNDLERLQKMDTEEVFHAYHLIIPESEEKIKNYKNIYGAIDYLYLRLKQAIESTEKQVGYIHRDQMYIKETIESLSNVMYARIKNIEAKGETSSSEHSFLVKHHKVYMALIEDRSEIGNYEVDFLLPFGNELRVSFKASEFFGELNDFIAKAIIRFNHIKENSTVFANELKDVRKEMKNSIERLTKINEEITCHNTSYTA
ncbi:hypothetical protein JXM83_00075 [Candidatus Woesearchaeota archaeon]|nr:hypothetical protein [Candidatus Woesearchaeota archaeon]